MQVYIVMITNTSNVIVQQQVDSIWYKWEDAAKRAHYLNGLYEKDKGYGLHAYYMEDIVQ